jgi:hypothetical protein
MLFQGVLDLCWWLATRLSLHLSRNALLCRLIHFCVNLMCVSSARLARYECDAVLRVTILTVRVSWSVSKVPDPPVCSALALLSFRVCAVRSRRRSICAGGVAPWTVVSDAALPTSTRGEHGERGSAAGRRFGGLYPIASRVPYVEYSSLRALPSGRFSVLPSSALSIRGLLGLR